MVANEVEQMLPEAAAEVLETMFFTSLAEEGDSAAPFAGPTLCAHLYFRGARSGSLGVWVPRETAREIAADFLGLEGTELTEARVGDVICEFANMVCGLLLGRLESNGLFELTRPELDSVESRPRNELAVLRTLALERGAMEVWLQWERGQ
jgi:CheY-specific phosphatase CheX